MHISFLFVGRFSKEKGVLLILSAIEQLVKNGITNFTFYFIGSGPLDKVIKTHFLNGTYIISYGRLPKEQNIARMKTMHYVVMPSLFLETFGLVALDALACGVPVVAEKKGGLIPFVLDDALEITPSTSLASILEHLIGTTTSESLNIWRKKALYTASLYTSQKRIDKFGQLSNNCKKPLLISDYAKDIGGIENYLFQVKGVLSDNGVATQLYGKTERVTGWWRKIDLLIAGLNCGAARDVYKKTTTEHFDLIRLHSIQRRLGRCTLAVLFRYKKTPVWCMYHDFGLLHPFPSAVYTIDQLNKCDSFFGYIREGKQVLGNTKRYLGGWLLVGAKYMYSGWLFYWLQKTVDVHLVPSAYLLPYVQKKLPLGAKIEVFSHFVSHAQDV